MSMPYFGYLSDPVFDGVGLAGLPLWFGGLEFNQRLPLCVS